MAASLKRLSSSFLGKTPSPSPFKCLFFNEFSSKLFVKGLSFSTTEEILAKEFSRFGEVINANIVMDKTRNRSKGFGYVSFAEEDDANKALIDMNGKLLDGRVVFVDKEIPKTRSKDHTPLQEDNLSQKKSSD